MDCGHNPNFEYLTQMHLEIIIFNMFFSLMDNSQMNGVGQRFFLFLFLKQTNKQTLKHLAWLVDLEAAELTNRLTRVKDAGP